MFTPYHLQHLLLFWLFGAPLTYMQTRAFIVDVGGGESNVLCIEKERQALLTFKQGLVDPSDHLSSWVEEEDCCSWKGVGCDNKSGHVVMLDLHGPYPADFYVFPSLYNGYLVDVFGDDVFGTYKADETSLQLGGEISSSLLDLQSLNYLDLSNNNFNMTSIPVFFGSFSNLLYLNLSSSSFRGRIPNQLGNLSNLEYLDLHNGIKLTFTDNLDWLSGLSSLKYLDMSGTNLSGSSLDHLPSLSLTHLYLANCDLGEIFLPMDHVNNISSLKLLDLSGNKLLCQSLKILENITSLFHLDLSWNRLGCSSPIVNIISPSRVSSLRYLSVRGTGLVSENLEGLDNITSLEILKMSSNNLASCSLLKACGNITSLLHLDLSENNFNCSIPHDLKKLVSVAHLDLSWNFFQGLIPHFVGEMTSLVSLILNKNHLQGPLPDSFGNSPSLSLLNLNDNDLEGGGIPKNLGKLCNLKSLFLARNILGGEISSGFWSGCIKNSLEILDFTGNKLTGFFPHELGTFPSLKVLRLSGNRMNGSLPESIGQFSGLVELDLSYNSLDGIISETHLTNLSKLRSLAVSSNSFDFNLTSDWIPPFQLKYIMTQSCRLGATFPSWLQTQKGLVFVDISDSGIQDTIPNWFWNFSSSMSFMNLSSNHIYGKLPNLSSAFANNWITLDLSSNQLSGSLPLVRNVNSLNLANNFFSGSISIAFFKVVTITNYPVYLDLSENRLTGSIPDCLMYLEKLHILNLANNKLSGEIPSSIGYMHGMQSLHLNNNRFSGNLPMSMKNCTELITIDVGENNLSGYIPPWIGESLPKLLILRFRSNQFNGNIPSQLCQLQLLQILDIAHNNIMGTIPRCVSNFSAMASTKYISERSINYRYISRYKENTMVVWKGKDSEFLENLGLLMTIDLSGNNLSGEVPREVMELSGLRTLNLSSNHLAGNIPSNIGHMVFLEALDFSMNRISGVIPVGLSNLSLLNHLNLSSNNLSGEIPRGSQLQTFQASSFTGNLDLCGLPLPVNCTRNEASDKEPPRDFKETDIPWFYGLGMGYILGLGGVCFVLIFKRSWRVAYFQFVDEYQDWVYVVTVINARKLRRKFTGRTHTTHTRNRR